MSTIGPDSEVSEGPLHVDFSNRPFWVKHFQAIHHWGVDVARGLALLFGIGTAALPSWGSKARWNNLLGGLAVRRTAGPSGHANSPHPSFVVTTVMNLVVVALALFVLRPLRQRVIAKGS